MKRKFWRFRRASDRSILSQRQLSEYLSLCDELGLSALVEAHDEAEVELAQRAGARIIGVNNRNLKDFSVDAKNSLCLRQRIPEGVLFVSESGVQSVEDVRRLREAERMRCWWEKR